MDPPADPDPDPTSPTEVDDGSAAQASAHLPERIGHYRVLRELGRGGMGTVYLAERDEPGLRKTVAVKVVSRGMDSAFVLRRFRTERQILAGLEHPGIARLYDGGTTDEGLPYFVMEYVDGEDLVAYCEARKLPIRTRLRLFVLVCEAVQYAHQGLVVHRDLKPSNILVTAAGEPKLLDFGIAKLLGPPIGDESAEQTASVVRLLTPDFASPEQVRGDRVTTASDVYALGVVLYELLSGHRPYRLKAGTAAQLERAILEKDVDAPSTALARDLRRQLRGDLDNVVLKALRKDPAERYATAAELADDVRRYLDGFPVRAVADRPAYRVAKFLRRHRTAVAAGAAVVLSLVAGLGIALRQARVAEAERRRAEALFQDVRGLANSVIYELHDAIGNLPGATPVRQLMVTRALEYLDRLAADSRGDVSLQRELADAYQRVAQVQGGGVGANLGDSRGALQSYGKALTIRQALIARTPVDSRDVLGLALLEFDLGALERVLGEPAKAERSFVSSAARLESLRRQGALPEDQRRRVAPVYQRLAEAQRFQGKHDAALASARQASAEAEAAWRARPEDAAVRSALAAASHQLAEVLADGRQYADALEWTRRARGLLEAALRENPLDAQSTRILLFVLNGEGRYLWELGDRSGSLKVRARALEVAEEAARRDPQDRWSQMGVVVAGITLADALLQAGAARESVNYFREALRIGRAAADADPQNRYVQLEAAAAEYGLGRARLAEGTPAARAEGCASLARVQQFWSALRAEGALPPGETEDLGRLPALRAPCR
jgi:tetratricopeptide (TPR) repeat protein/tRNA A-37 threonylcarbamoyl transferase component Bud32